MENGMPRSNKLGCLSGKRIMRNRSSLPENGAMSRAYDRANSEPTARVEITVRKNSSSAGRALSRFTNRGESQCHSGLGSRGSGRERLEFFSRLEAHGFAGWNAYLLSGARVAADAGLARLH